MISLNERKILYIYIYTCVCACVCIYIDPVYISSFEVPTYTKRAENGASCIVAVISDSR